MGLLATTLALWIGIAADPAAAVVQPEPQNNPVYVDDSPAAAESLAGVPGQLAMGNLDAAVRVLQRLLEEEGDRAALSLGDDPDLFISVRSRVNDTLMKTPALLTRYREAQGPLADRMLEEGSDEVVERTRLLTRSGFEAALRVAQRELEAARFESALLTLRQLESHPDRTGDAGRDAAELLQAVARYVDRGDVWDRAERWAKQSGAPTGLRGAETWPEATLRRGTSPLDSQAPVSLVGMLPRPLWSVPVGIGPVAPLGNRSMGEIPPFAQGLWVLPTLSDETVYASDGNTVSALGPVHAVPTLEHHPGCGTQTRSARPRVGDQAIPLCPAAARLAGDRGRRGGDRRRPRFAHGNRRRRPHAAAGPGRPPTLPRGAPCDRFADRPGQVERCAERS